MSREKITKNFYKDEFACRCCGLNNIELELVHKLQALRDAMKMPLIVTSGTRCKVQNDRKGGKPRSDHLTGMAVDIGCRDAQMRRIVLVEALKIFPTIGVKKDCLHFSIGLPARVFTYD